MSKSDNDLIDLTELDGGDANDGEAPEDFYAQLESMIISAKESAAAARVALAAGREGEANDLMEVIIDAMYLARYTIAKARGDEAQRMAIFAEAHAACLQN